MRIGDGVTGENGVIAVRIRTATWSLDCRAVPVEGPIKDGSPSYQMFRDEFEIGAAWLSTSAREREYLKLKFDSPEQPRPIFVTLWPIRGKPGLYDVIFARKDER